MTEGSFDAWPAPAPGCRITVAIPARDEAQLLPRTLAALAAQEPLPGEPVRGAFDAIVFVNNSADDTAERARAFAHAHPHLPLTVVRGELPADRAHVGTARKLVLDAAARRWLAAGKPRNLIASTDADTILDPHWIAHILRAAATADAIAGYVTLGEAEQATLLAPVRLLYSRELSYRRTFAQTQSAIDPRPEDPAPRHASFVGASFAVTAATYVAAGGLPPLAVLEDLAFSHALRRIDARVRHSLLVRATTSARRLSRAAGGFGTFLAGLDQRGAAGETFLVQHPRETLNEFESWAALRRIRSGCGGDEDRETLSRVFELAEPRLLPLLHLARPSGAIYELLAAANPARRRYAPVPVETATAALRAATLVSNAAAPARSRAASGAG